MKLVRENINEKFTQNSDPVEDLGIGIKHLWNNLDAGQVLRVKKKLIYNNDPSDYDNVGTYVFITKIYNRTETFVNIHYEKCHTKRQLKRTIKKWKTGGNFSHNLWEFSFSFFKKYFEVVQPRELNEKFTQDGDPIRDLGIGTIHFWETQYQKLFPDEDTCDDIYYRSFKKLYYDSFFNSDLNQRKGVINILIRTCVHTIRKLIMKIVSDPQESFEHTFKEESEVYNFDRYELLKIRITAANWLKENFYIDVNPYFGDFEELKNTEGLNLNEKFTQDGDPIKDMGIGAKFVYYRFYVADYSLRLSYSHITQLNQSKQYRLLISGDTFGIRDILKNNNFKWSEGDYAWKSMFAYHKDTWINTICPELFKKIESRSGYVIQLHGKITKFDEDMNRTFSVPGWEKWEYPSIPDGNGAKVYIKQWHHHAPVVGAVGKGTYFARELLRYEGFNFNKDSHMWENIYNKEKTDDMIKYLQERGYNVIDGRKKVNEKFTQDSDPIHDLGIGKFKIRFNDYLKPIFKEYKEGKSVYYCFKKFKQTIESMIKGMYVKGKKWKVRDNQSNGHWVRKDHIIKVSTVLSPGTIFNNPIDSGMRYFTVLAGNGKKYCLYLDPEYEVTASTNEKVYEKFKEDSDPIKDLGIGIFHRKIFKTENEMYEWLSNILPALLGTEEIPNDILNDPSYEGYFLHRKYSDKIGNYAWKYFFDKHGSHLFNYHRFRIFLHNKYPDLPIDKYQSEPHPTQKI